MQVCVVVYGWRFVLCARRTAWAPATRCWLRRQHSATQSRRQLISSTASRVCNSKSYPRKKSLGKLFCISINSDISIKLQFYRAPFLNDECSVVFVVDFRLLLQQLFHLQLKFCMYYFIFFFLFTLLLCCNFICCEYNFLLPTASFVVKMQQLLLFVSHCMCCCYYCRKLCSFHELRKRVLRKKLHEHACKEILKHTHTYM